MFTNAKLSGVDFTKTKRSNLGGSYLKHFEGADLLDANFNELRFDGAIFKDANLTGASFEKANLYQAEFRNSVLKKKIRL